MVLPMTLFTPEDLLRYLYKESSPDLTVAIEAALKEDWMLREKLQVLRTSADGLDKIHRAPSRNTRGALRATIDGKMLVAAVTPPFFRLLATIASVGRSH